MLHIDKSAGNSKPDVKPVSSIRNTTIYHDYSGIIFYDGREQFKQEKHLFFSKFS
jgi:hypothetical protein